MVSIILEITHGFRNQGEKCLVKHIKDLAKCFLKTVSEASREKQKEIRAGASVPRPPLFVAFREWRWSRADSQQVAL